ncbi:MAG: AI-2E family transporter [Ruminococcaceae bacterium]|nr:AI-2E family transporter [Oscillospiraceae bacterium]
MKIENVKKPLWIITYAILLYFIVNNLATFLDYINSGIKLFTPLIIGGVLAFILNLILRFTEKKLFNKIFAKKLDKVKKVRRPVCVVIAYLVFAGIIYIIAKFISPKIQESISTFSANVPIYVNSITNYFSRIAIDYNIAEDIWTKFLENFGIVVSNTSQFLNSALPKIVDFTKTLTSSVFDVFIGIVFSAYMLLSKEKLILTVKKVMYAHMKKETADKTVSIFKHANKVFRSFVGGQITEAFILGILCYIGMLIFRMPYAPLISVIMGVSSLVPVIGPIVGTIPSALLILLESPVVALWFVVFIIVLQQVEGNIIYPRVVGSAIGLSGFWVLLAVTVGGSLFGVLGILLGVPLMAVLYTLYGEFVNKKISEKDIGEL